MNLLKTGFRLAKLAGALLALPAMADEVRIQPPELAISITEHVAMPATQALQKETSQLLVRVTALCAMPNRDNLRDAQDSWRRASEAWRRLEATRFGPARVESLTNLFAPWPFDVQALQQAIASAPTDPTSGQAINDWMQQPTQAGGLPALEYLLFAENTPDKQLAQFSQNNRCRYAIWQSAGVARRATTLGYEWAGLRSGMNYDMSYHRPFLTEALTRSVINLKELAGWKLASKEVTPTESRFPDWRAHQTKQSLLATFDGIQQVLLGSAKGVGFDDYLASRGKDDLVTELRAKFFEARQALDQLPDDLAAHAMQSRGERLLAQRKLNALADFLAGPVSQGMGFAISLSQ
ncbi:imelysin family protein [Andreprevotia chitinilytica]|uniref:imelysin family protein n=1 Tax=Andreprevotia chitinilytica TaxID=396808 RepID=UPI000554E49E|nr:imelysin family protein [Andreprevotia chitinilytica]